MRPFHMVGGLPRSGSTLLCNILNQNPCLHVSSTSPVHDLLSALPAKYDRSPEVRGMLIRHREDTYNLLGRCIRAYCEEWYCDVQKPVIIDKHRFWNYRSGLISCVWPQAKIIAIVRDLRSIFASIEKRHQETALLDSAPNLMSMTVVARAEALFSPEGTIGSALFGMEDLIRRNPKNVIRIKYEDLCTKPEAIMGYLYDQLNEPYFAHDFENIVNVSDEVDELYGLKYPHQGDGPLRNPDPTSWRPWVHPDVEKKIFGTFPLYMSTFGYLPHSKAACAVAAEYVT